MFFGESLRMAVANLWGHKVRSLLTILGVVIGVGSVLSVVTLGKSFEQSIVGEFDSLDQRTVYVYSSLTPAGQGPPNCMQYCSIWTDVDLQALQALDGVEHVVVSAEVASTSLAVAGHELTFEGLTATVPEADELRVLDEYASGGPFVLGSPQVVLGSQVAKYLSPEANITAGIAIQVRLPDGRIVNGTVAGVLMEDTNFFGDRNGRVYVPIDPFLTATRPSPSTGELGRVYNGFTLVAEDARVVNRVRDEAKSYVQQESDARELKVEGQTLSVSTPSDIQGQISAAFDQVTIFISAIGGVSLVVGAIGIANIMLVSVTERTREIGVMKAIGARDGEILILFLVEAFLIGLAGAIVGIALGLFGGYGIVNSGLFGDDFPFVLPYDWVGYSIAVGIGVGLVAGLLPARRATRIQPIQALAYE